ncbi:MAG: heme exporter protein CcmD [Burkholderiales bacterium]|nr:heme exporter protein CcmD [Burkholderiales bacterium]
MNWGSAAEFFAMGGYATYVWGSYAVSVLVIVGELLLHGRRRRTCLRRLGRRVRPEKNPS